MDSVTRPEAWCAKATWTHRRVRFPWVPLAWRQHLPAHVQYAVCTTEAPATECMCGEFSIRWGYFPAVVDDTGL